MTLPRKDALGREEETLPQQQFPAKGIRLEKQIEGDISAHAGQHETAGSDPLAAAGIGAAESGHTHEPQHNLSATTDPGVTDDDTAGYSTGSVWINRETPAIFQCVTAAAGVADWNQIDAIAAAADHDHTGGGDGGKLTKPELDDYMILGEISAPGGDPAANKGWLYVKDDGGVSGLYFEADDGTVTDLLAGGAHAASHVNGDAIQNAAADGATKGIATFPSADFGAAAGVISLKDTVAKAFTGDSGAAAPSTHLLKIEGGTGIVTEASAAKVVVTGHAEDHKARHAGGADALYSVHQYTFGNDDGSDTDVATGALITLHSTTANAETCARITVHAETTPGSGDLVFNIEESSAEDLDGASWSNKKTVTCVPDGSDPDTFITTTPAFNFTARRGVRINITTAPAGWQDISIIVEVERQLTT